jgi:hypothetical protein
MGRFLLGSTVIMLFSKATIVFYADWASKTAQCVSAR